MGNRTRIVFTSAVPPFEELLFVQRPLWPAYLAAYAEKIYGPDVFDFNIRQQSPTNGYPGISQTFSASAR